MAPVSERGCAILHQRTFLISSGWTRELGHWISPTHMVSERDTEVAYRLAIQLIEEEKDYERRT